MKIVFTTTVYLPHIGGIEVCIHELAQHLIREGHKVTVIVADKDCKEIKREVIENETIVRLPAYEIGHFFFLKSKKYLQIIDGIIKDADIIHVNVCKFLFDYFAKKKEQYAYRLICTSHGWLYHTPNNKFIKDLYFRNVVAKYAPVYDGIINVSPQDQEIARSFGIQNTCVILNGVNLNKFSGIEPKKSFDNKFVYFGRISENKGIYQCLNKLVDYKNDYTFYVIGKCEDSEYLNKLKTFIADNNMKNKIIFCGQLSNEDVREKIIESDIILMPSLHEGFGMTLVECLASNRPIIANDIESYRYILKSVNAEVFLFDFENEETKIQNKITELLGMNIKAYDVEQYSVDTMIKKTFQIYGIKNNFV